MVALSILFNINVSALSTVCETTGANAIFDLVELNYPEDPRLPKEEGKFWAAIAILLPNEDYPDMETNSVEEDVKRGQLWLDIVNSHRRNLLDLAGVTNDYVVNTRDCCRFLVYVTDEQYDVMSKSVYYNEYWFCYNKGVQPFVLEKYNSSYALALLRASVGIYEGNYNYWEYDLNGDLVITSEDAFLALRISVGDYLLAMNATQY